MINFQKKQIKIISFVIAAVFVLSIVAIGVSQYDTGMASAASSSNVGVVDYRQLVSSSPQLAQVRQQLQDEQKKAEDDFNAKAATMSDQEKSDYAGKVREDMLKKQKELLDPIMETVKANVQSVADAKGLAVVLDKNSVIYGGQDITQDVMNKMKKQ
ncbi:OmpH family outer membrane protein [Pectinatus frisingensis]|jgi:outer membrane protein|uniref:OmpH family outer membrane protein n=1 Tax=Pectinatus frisingensis TaxID=865 RepID=UPI0015F52A03|nr:OmpH family outer membrane protein [Pectinatus frisingensis]